MEPPSASTPLRHFSQMLTAIRSLKLNMTSRALPCELSPVLVEAENCGDPPAISQEEIVSVLMQRTALDLAVWDSETTAQHGYHVALQTAGLAQVVCPQLLLQACERGAIVDDSNGPRHNPAKQNRPPWLLPLP
eukprot:CAMPEP_0171072802 /NCGR_PEP_ID=MMETSP0766_2-20121228/11097_1 /TAXON_ID=439317 /ORGANISM="Gambierdiscus australes, Strain CAWD 149" /LENGTH=133 /DNA_ID=CAMNT_0011529427 /DNA_START=66 /DNA_END=465 /DNA_ORIENTATION=+